MKVFIWIFRISFIIGIVITAAEGMVLYGEYDSDLLIADSAVQATQLSNEYILRSFSHLIFIVTEGVFYIAFEIAINTYYVKKAKQEEEQSMQLSA